MGKDYEHIAEDHKTFIENQRLFFVGTSPLSAEGRINLSPKGLDCFRVLSPIQRDHVIKWADVKGREGLEEYKKEKNMAGIDGLPTALSKIL